LEAKDELRALEFSFLHQAKGKISESVGALHEFAEYISRLDVFVAQALLAHEKKFTQPEFSLNNRLSIIEGRHPVIEEFLPRDQQFIPNDLNLRGSMELLKEETMKDD